MLPSSRPSTPDKDRHRASRTWLLTGLTLLLTLALAACGASTPGHGNPPKNPLPPDTPPSGPIANVSDQLNELGVDVDAIASAPRKLDASVTVTGEYAPLGASARLAPREIFAAGIGDNCVDTEPTTPDGPGPRVLSFEIYDETVAAVAPWWQCYRYEMGRFTPTTGPAPDSGLTQPGTQSTRAIVTGDFDGDGFEEGGVVNARLSAGDGYWWLWGYQTDQGATPGQNTFTTKAFLAGRQLGHDPVKDVAAVAGDLTGDGRDDVVVAVLKDGSLDLIPYPQTSSDTMDARAGATTNRIDLTDREGVLSVRMAVGNLDTDPQLELVVLVRSLADSGTAGAPAGEVRYYVYDDLATYHSEGSFKLPLLESGTLTYDDPDGGTRNLLTADVSLGDFDGDGLDEIATTGIGRFAYPDPCAAYTFAYTVRDDLAHGGGELASKVEQVAVPSSSCTDNVGSVYEVMARSLDWDGNYTKELLANNRIFALHDGQLDLVTTVDDVYPGSQGGPFSEATVALATGDVNNDGRDDVLTYATNDATLHMQGMGSFSRDISLSSGGPSDSYPVLSAYDTDLDGTTVQYVPHSHRVVLTEPVIIAALAAPPYDEDLGQNSGDASTSYGTSSSSGTSQETTVSFTVHTAVGLKAGGSVGLFEFSGEYKEEFDYHKDKTKGTAYQTTYTDTYQTVGRDAVVFTSFPYDAYDYAVVASDQSQLVGQTMTVMLPRRPATRIVSKEYFNARVPPGGLKIDDRVFRHTAGDVSSYMNQQDMKDLRDRVVSGGFGPRLFLASSTKTVGQGTTSTSTSIELSKEDYYSEAVGYQRTHSLNTTVAGVVSEFSMGSGKSNSVTTRSGEATTVSSTVPSITVDDTTNPDAVYDYGMFTYMFRDLPKGGDPGQLFQVVNFWTQ